MLVPSAFQCAFQNSGEDVLIKVAVDLDKSVHGMVPYVFEKGTLRNGVVVSTSPSLFVDGE